MQSHTEIKELFKSLECCVLIPTYNNAGTLKRVIEEVNCYTDDIIVVNDGSTDTTYQILSSLTYVNVVNYIPNRGKGMALRRGFEYAYSKGFKYAITIDSDGQHFADDIPVFINKIQQSPDTIIIGARNMEQVGIPGKSSFGHKFSNFWFKFETGITLPDTQSGFRVYPLEAIKGINFYTLKYEFEIEVIVRTAWRGVPVDYVPIKVYYAPAGERVSHFRPFKDFSRVSVLNTVLVTLAIVYYIPLRFVGNLRKKNIKQLVLDSIANKEESNLKKSYSIALGVFMGIIPVWGYQLILALAIAHFLKLNKILAALASNISIPPLIPVIIYVSYAIGVRIFGTTATNSTDINWEAIQQNLAQYIVGSFCLATVAALVIGTISYMLLVTFHKKT